MPRPFLLALLLVATGAAAQEPQDLAHRDLWCGLAFQYAAGELPADATARQQQVIPRYARGAEMLIERAAASYRRAGYSAARLAAMEEALRAEIATALGTSDTPYSFQDCERLLPP